MNSYQVPRCPWRAPRWGFGTGAPGQKATGPEGQPIDSIERIGHCNAVLRY